ncbi:MAG: hypothetical protein NTZ48_03270 [Candidatus Omnitrophica bacterium]|nr:hypothetical protein [Candidatus Omnitrophota bacterium]
MIKNRVVFLISFFVLINTLLSGCSSNPLPKEWGKRFVYNGGSLFYTSAVTESETRKLGDYLLKAGFFQKGKRGTVQLNKEAEIYQFRMVVRKGLEKDMEFFRTAGLFAAELSRGVFEGKPLEIHLCDDKLKTIQVVTFELTDSTAEQKAE